MITEKARSIKFTIPIHFKVSETTYSIVGEKGNKTKLIVEDYKRMNLLQKLNCHCRECGSVIYCSDVPPEIAIRKGLDKLEQNYPYDYWYFCSNSNCIHHEGFGMDDMYYNHENIDDSWIVKDN